MIRKETSQKQNQPSVLRGHFFPKNFISQTLPATDAFAGVRAINNHNHLEL